ncbi:hypothetical protein [Bowdeniella massiliensis]|nr:hypothetical protein [Bowdeniella massiliensis]
MTSSSLARMAFDGCFQFRVDVFPLADDVLDDRAHGVVTSS